MRNRDEWLGSSCLVVATVLAAPVAWLLSSASAFTAAGDFDSAFGTGGIVRLDLGTTTIPGPIITAPNGDFVVGGQYADGSSSGAFLARFQGDGQLRASFGDGGVVQMPGENSAATLAFRPDGRLLVGHRTMGIRVLNSDGTVFATLADEPSRRGDIAFDAHGGYVTIQGGVTDARPITRRFTPVGLPDPTFAGDGQKAIKLPAQGTLNRPGFPGARISWKGKGYGETKQVRAGGAGASGSDGSGRSVAPRVAVGSDPLDRREVRLLAGNAARLGPSIRARQRRSAWADDRRA